MSISKSLERISETEGLTKCTGKHRDLQRSTIPYAELLGLFDEQRQLQDGGEDSDMAEG